MRGTPHPDELARFHQVKQLLHLETEPLPGPRSPAKLIGKPADAI
jgi:hypothetical protein